MQERVYKPPVRDTSDLKQLFIDIWASVSHSQIKTSLRGDANTARWLYSKAEPKIFAPPQTPFPEARNSQNLISWRWSLPSPINPVWWGSMDAISSYRSNRTTNKHTDRGDYNTLRRSLVCSVNIIDETVDQWRIQLRACEKSREDHSEHMLN